MPILCTIGGSSEERLAIEDKSKKERVIKCIHDTSHFGINRTLNLVSSKYYWPGLTNDVKQYVSVEHTYNYLCNLKCMCFQYLCTNLKEQSMA